MIFDPVYFLFLAPGLALSFWASWRTKSTFKKYSRIRSAQGLTGAEAARAMLQRAGIYDVEVKPTRGFLSDHYNPLDKTLALSEATYASQRLPRWASPATRRGTPSSTPRATSPCGCARPWCRRPTSARPSACGR